MAAQIIEEVGRLSDDGRYEQLVILDQVVMEWSAGLPLFIEPRTFEEWATSCVSKLAALPAPARQRVELACDWYWLGIGSADPVLSYLQFWFVIEVLGMPKLAEDRPGVSHPGVPAWWRLSRLVGRAGLSTQSAGCDRPSRQARRSADKRELLAAFAQVFLGFELGLRPEAATRLVRTAAGLK